MQKFEILLNINKFLLILQFLKKLCIYTQKSIIKLM